MSKHTPPTPAGRRGRARVALAVAPLVSAVWAFWPLHAASVPPSPAAASAAPLRAPSAPLDLAAFRAPLWVAPIPPPPPPAPPPPPPPLKLQLVAISRDGPDAALAATIFDPDTNKILTLRQGQSIGPRTISRIAAAAIDIKDSLGTRTLSLRPDATSDARGGQ